MSPFYDLLKNAHVQQHKADRDMTADKLNYAFGDQDRLLRKGGDGRVFRDPAIDVPLFISAQAA
jgi:hypothetical protein